MLDGSNAISSFSVRDVAQTKQFYSEVLGLEIADGPMDGLLELNLGSAQVMMYGKDDHEPASFTVLNFPVDDIETTVDELNGRGVQFENYGGELAADEKGIVRNEYGPAIAWFKDPSGNVLAVMETP